MTRKQGERKQTQAAAAATGTAPRPVDAQGRELDQWGLPINGPARAGALAELGKPDPNDDLTAWTEAAIAPAAPLEAVGTETQNG